MKRDEFLASLPGLGLLAKMLPSKSTVHKATDVEMTIGGEVVSGYEGLPTWVFVHPTNETTASVQMTVTWADYSTVTLG